MAKLEVELKNISKVLKDKAVDAIERFGGETEHLMKKMKKRGERTQHEGKKQLDKIVSQMRKSDVFSTASEYYEEVEKALEDRMIKVLNFLQIPTKDEMDSLARKVKAMNEKLDALQKGRARGVKGRKSARRRGRGTASTQTTSAAAASGTDKASGMELK